MNEYDSERMAGILQHDGYELTADEKEADFIVVNTCSVRQHAEDRETSYIGKAVKDKKVIVAGCMAQNLKDSLIKKYPNLYAVLGTFQFSGISKIIKDNRKKVYVDETEEIYDLNIERTDKIKGYTTIMQGCDNYCSYCVVPYVRGRERSRSAADIIREIKIMADNGYTEVMLLGQNVNSYGRDKDEINFSELLKEVSKIDAIKRIRFMTSHPKDLTMELIDTVAGNEKLCKHFHLPLQSGSDKILSLMNRKYTAKEYIEKISKIRSKISDVAITSDLLVGFPYEEEQDFKDTVSVMESVRFDNAYLFKYSARPGTKAAEYPDSVPEEEKLRRLNYILDLQKKISEDIGNKYIGRESEVLVEDTDAKDINRLKATTDNAKNVFFEGSKDLIGKIIKVKITGAKGASLAGEMI
jgi:tRNA-2-methylthio-N6-dimethylallyladenosine synthase